MWIGGIWGMVGMGGMRWMNICKPVCHFQTKRENIWKVEKEKENLVVPCYNIKYYHSIGLIRHIK